MLMKALMEDTLCEDGLCSEHGLCLYVETEKHKLLADTGASELTWKNAETLGIDLSAVDTVVVSHGHYDHAGGVLSFVQRNPNARIYLRDNAGEAYYHRKPLKDKYIGIAPEIMDLPQLVKVTGDLVIDEELSLFTGITGRRLWPSGNLSLKVKEGDTFRQDDFSHEQCLVIKEGEQYTLLSGCAHNGILNILDRFREIYQCDPSVVVSGFHMARHEYTEADIQHIRETAEELKKMNTTFYTGHCTGEKALEVMQEIMGDQVRRISSLR